MTAVSNSLAEYRVSRAELTHRVVVSFSASHPGSELVLEFAATPTEADEFACAARRTGLLVTVDRRVSADLRPLPCRSLWH
ncbi:hypothetical protein ACFVMC_12545 [Nocardia sp. NPDC127579]|uniref:hypothetical protein n=1 Tax=Nocardia sp. NPDC127579 TaxID=3345402 RepID=UPI003643A351